MAFKDLREFLGALEAKGELQKIKTEVDWDEEIGGIAQEAVVKHKPSLLFENIKGYKDTHGKRLSINSMATLRRVNIALGLEPDTHPKETLLFFKERINNRIKPRLVNMGEVKENLEKGDRVNILEFPVPKLHAEDGGRYFGTWHLVIVKDPDSGWVNSAMYRAMVHDEKRIGLFITPVQQWWQIARKYASKGLKVPTAIAIGLDPLLIMAGITPLTAGISEFDLAGSLRGEPVDLMETEELRIPVPASAEIVVEGLVDLDPNTYLSEGPFGEYPGYYSSLWSVKRPVMEVRTVMHRNDPIFISSMEGLGAELITGDSGWPISISYCAFLWSEMERMGVPGITGVWTDPDTIQTNLFISIKQLYYGHARQVASSLWGHPSTIATGKYLVVVDDDVDIFDLKRVNAAIANRSNPERDLVVFKGTMGGPLDPSVHPHTKEKTGGVGRWDRVLIDATWPMDWETRPEWGGLRHPPSCKASPETLEMVKKRWKEYGF